MEEVLRFLEKTFRWDGVKGNSKEKKVVDSEKLVAEREAHEMDARIQLEALKKENDVLAKAKDGGADPWKRKGGCPEIWT